MQAKTAIIIGAGPGGLTAADELLRRSDIQPVILEMSDKIGGLARTENYKGNRMDIGPHRFFSKSDRVMEWWLDRLPLQVLGGGEQTIAYQGRSREINTATHGPDPDTEDRVMLLRPRKSRILHRRKFFDYPISLSFETVRKLGLWRMTRIGFSYLRSLLFPYRKEETLEQFFINRFGRELYLTFFKDYTEKVWGLSCSEISAEWGAQRVKSLSIGKAVLHAMKKPFTRSDVAQKSTETSLIEQFLYPKFGPGQMWEQVADDVRKQGGRILMNRRVEHVLRAGERIVGVECVNTETGERETISGDYFLSTMPIKQLIQAMDEPPPDAIREVGEGLTYRDFVNVGLLLSELKARDDSKSGAGGQLRDNWIYIQEPDVLVGRVQIVNNWSPYMVASDDTVWIGLEYFCNEGDKVWSMSDEDLVKLGVEELEKIGVIDSAKVLDGTVFRALKTYPAYFGTYERFDELRAWLDQLENLFLIGRNGMHRYNNMDHSMLTAMVAVDNILSGVTDKSNIWAVNSEQEYHEERSEKPAPANQDDTVRIDGDRVTGPSPVPDDAELAEAGK